MMKKTGIKHLIRSIRKGGVSFLAVAVIAAVSISIFHGFQSSANAILERADAYFVENNLETLEIACANGITPEDLDAIAQWEGVEAIEGGYTDSALWERENGSVLVQVRSLTETVNLPTVVQGELPAAADEVAIEEYMAEQEGVAVGDTITLRQDGCLNGETYRVSAIINIPVFSCVSLHDTRGTGEAGLGTNEYYVCLPEAAFNAEHYSDCYTVAYLDSTALDGIYYFSDEYAEKEAAYLEALEPLAQDRAQARYDALEQEIHQELDEARAELDDGRAEIEENQTKLENARAELQQGEADYADAQAAYDDQMALLDSSRAQLESQLAALGLSTDLDEAMTALAALGQAGAPLQTAIAQFQAGEAQLEAVAASLDEAAQELENARTEIADGEQELEEARADLADGEQALADAEEEAADLQLQDWILSGRENVGDIRGISTIVDSIYGLSIVMALLFLLVAVVISFAAITRVIREQRVLIGAQKALGFTPGEILRHYTFYNLICAVLGILMGWLVGIVIVENMSLAIFAPKFRMGGIPLAFTWSTALLSAVLCLAVFLIATFATCTRMSREPAIDLLRGDAPTRGKRYFFEKWGAYQKLNLYSRTMLKNVLSDKGRMATTMVGVMGCTALLVACFSMKLGIQNAVSTHFDQCASYDAQLAVDTEEAEVEEFAAVLEKDKIDFTLIQEKLKNFRAEGGTWETAHVVTAADTASLEGFLNLRDPSGNALALPQDGVLVSSRAAEELGLAVGSTVEIMDADGRGHTCQVVGVMEHFLPYHMLVTSDSFYESLMGEAPDKCVYLLKGDVSDLEAQVAGMDGFLTLRDRSEYQRSGGELDMVIAVCTALSAVMSVLVLLNQISMYISRKARELAVMRVNGYTLAQTKAYVYKDNIVLIALGLLFGCLFGIAMAYVDIRVIEAGAEHYVRTPNLLACLLAVVIMAVFAVAVNIVALRRINHLSLTNVSAN